MNSEIASRVSDWLLSTSVDPLTKAKIKELQTNNPTALIDAFYTDLTFGTGGLRGIMDVGPNRMNVYTIRRATEGLAQYICKQGSKEAGVFIGFDSRHHSQEFALEAARVLANHGIPVYLLKEMRPTPFISFGCRFLKCRAALMITASHNPKEYNGYKVYWSDGAQVVPPHDTGIMEEVNSLKDWLNIDLSPENTPFIHLVGEELDTPYLEAISSLQHLPKENKAEGKELQITYSSLHGTGITLVPKALASWGFTRVNLVEKQVIPDGNFPTTPFPNPEHPETLELGSLQMLSTKSDLFIATDPDADRIGVVVNHKGKAIALSGNEMAALCLYFLCNHLPDKNKQWAVITTIVTTELLKTIAHFYKIPCFEVLTGFKYIGEMIHKWEKEKSPYTFLFGAEESYGCLLGTHARDKDAIVASCLIAEIALFLKQKGKTLIDLLHEIYREFGLFRESQLSINFDAGQKGHVTMGKMMQAYRLSPPSSIGDLRIIEVIDLAKSSSLHLPLSDVLIFRLEDQSKVVIRPSGTEAKVKIYLSTQEKNFASLDEAILKCDFKLKKIKNLIEIN